MAQSTSLPTYFPANVQAPEHSSSLSMAIGVGIGVPLGIGTIGLLGFVFWKEAARQRRNKSQRLTPNAVSNLWNQTAVDAADASYTELPDDQRPGELDGNARAELCDI